MVEHICKKCGKIFTRKDAFNKHTNRIKPCTGQVHDILSENLTSILDFLKIQQGEMTTLREEIKDLHNIIKEMSIK